MARREYQFRTRQDAEDAWRRESNRATVNAIALQECMRGNYETLRVGKTHLRLIRLTGAHGGIVVVSREGYSSAHYLEEWVHANKPSGSRDPDVLEIQRAAQQALIARNKAYDQEVAAAESLEVARRMEEKAKRLRRGPAVAGDAERNRETQRQRVREWLRVGMKVDTILFGYGVVKRINKKTATVEHTWNDGRTSTTRVELSWLKPAEAEGGPRP